MLFKSQVSGQNWINLPVPTDQPSLSILVRVRPLTGTEKARIPEEAGDNFFNGDGHLGGTPVRSPAGMGGMWREVVGE